MTQVTIQQASTRLSDLVAAAKRGEEVIIESDNHDKFRIVPVKRDRPQPRFGSAKGLMIIHEGFDEPLDDFKEYME